MVVSVLGLERDSECAYEGMGGRLQAVPRHIVAWVITCDAYCTQHVRDPSSKAGSA